MAESKSNYLIRNRLRNKFIQIKNQKEFIHIKFCKKG